MTTTLSKVLFESHATAYSLNNAYWLALAAQIAYQDKTTIQPAVAKLGLNQFEFLSRRDTEGYIAANDDIIIVAFRGTEPTHLRDLLADAQFHKVQGPLGEVHRGFLGAFKLVKDDLLSAIQRLRDKSHPQSLWCTGHSLGGALAVVAAAQLLVDGHAVNGLYTFGQPRVGDEIFATECARRLAGQHFRFVNNNDTVTRVAPRVLGYAHSGEVCYIDTAGKIQTDINFWDRFLERVKGRMEDFLKPGSDGLKDHSMRHYVEHIGSALKSGG
ncbi:MAG: lipase family protein [Nitrospira sp.]